MDLRAHYQLCLSMLNLIHSVYRIGMALTDSLDELITSGAITPQLAMKVLQQVLWRPRSHPSHG